LLLKKTKITQFKELVWKIKIKQRKEILSMHIEIPKSQEVGSFAPCFPPDSSEDNQDGRRKREFHSIWLEDQGGKPTDGTKYKIYIR
jgi:hypothetical protein